MGLQETKKFLHRKANSHQTKEAAHRMDENLWQLYIWQRFDNQNIQGPQKTKLPKNQWTNEEMSKWTEQSFFKGKSPNVKKHVKKCSTVLAIKEMEIKNTLRFHLTLVRMAISKNMNNNKCWWGFRERNALVCYWWECRLV
jgi:hypothetical protein